MSIVFPKNKRKRSRSPPSEANNSFVKNVTSRVSGLLPAAVTKWFSSPKSSANGSAATADVTDSSTEDEAPESPSAQPLSKRLRLTSQGTYNHYSSTETISINTDLNDSEPRTSFGTVQSPPGRTTFRRETNYVSTPLRAPEETVADRTENGTSTFKPQHTVSSIGSTIATKRKSLFDAPNSGEASARACAKTASNAAKDPKQPRFKPSLLGSPFYPGRTMYGGASFSYINHPNIKNRKTTVVNESTVDNSVSASTRRIMDLLEHYSSPLSEARRIPQYTRPQPNTTLSSSLNTTSPPSNKSISYKTQELHVPNIASILRLKQKSRLADTTTTARQIIASHSSTVDYQPYYSPKKQNREQTENQTEKESSDKMTTKVKSRLSRPQRKSTEMEMPTPVELPSAVLQIEPGNLPKFTFGSTVASTSAATSAPITSTPFTSTPNIEKTSKINETPLRKPDIVTSANPYKFSSPVRLASDQPQTNATLPKFTFGSPERSVEKMYENKDDVSCIAAQKEAENKVTEKDWQCADCWVFNKPDKDQCICCGGKKPSKDSKKSAKCSVCKLADSQPSGDKCVNCEKIKINNISKPEAKSDDSSKWKCEDCWVSNDSSKQNCVCCGAKKPVKTAAVTQNAVASNKDSEWKCEDCWIKNKSSVEKCAACGATKPGAKPSAAPVNSFSSPATKPPDNPFKNIVKSQNDKWECPSCLVRNDGDKTKCVCCETEREGVTKENDKKSFNFGMNPSTTFKFGIDPKLQAASASKPIEVKFGTESKNEESETNNNVLSKTPTFTFGLPAKKSEDQPDAPKKLEEKHKEKTDSAPKMTLSFGIPKTVTPEVSAAATLSVTPAATTLSVASTASPVFGIHLKPVAPKTTEENKEKSQEVPKQDFATQNKLELPKSLPNIFASPLPASQPQEKSLATALAPEKPVIGTVAVNATPAAENKDAASKPQPATSSAAAVPQPTPTFSFGSGGGFKLNPNLFATPTTTATATFGSPLNSAPANTTPIFQKTEPTTTAPVTLATSVFPKSDTVSLFQKSEPVPAPVPAPAPMFSFGSSSAATQPAQTQKPNFNFSFGSNNNSETPFGNNNKTETISLFKPPDIKFSFGAATENKFTLPTTNSIGSANPMTGGTLGGGNGPATNSIGGNILSGGNSLPANTIAGNNNNPLQTQSGGMFGVQKENVWAANNNTNNIFASNTNANALQKPGAFTFGSSTPFNGSSSAAAPAFGGGAPAAGGVFGLGAAGGGGMFASAAPSQPSCGVFGAPQPPAGVFGSPSAPVAAPTFGTPNASIPTFEAPSLTPAPAPAPAFNFGGQQQATGVFGFGQQPQQQGQTGGMYAFGGATAGAPQMQFNMGSAPNSAAVSQRRMRKAVRRTTQR